MTKIDFSPLKYYSSLFTVYIWAKRLRMVLFRVALVGFIIVIYLGDGISYSSSGPLPFYLNPFYYLLFWFFSTMVLVYSMSGVWKKFARVNHLEVSYRSGMSNDWVGTKVPSFRGKKTAQSLSPVRGYINGQKFIFFTRMYKEGGFIRWRERKMDSVLSLNYDEVRMPHIVINATQNEQARRPNLTTAFDPNWKFQFEGVQGAHYDVYCKPENRILALQLFTPDVLEKVYEYMPLMDIEVKGSKVWFVQRYGTLNDQLAKSMFAALDKFMPEFEKQLKSARLV